jgi:hypothetical protein
MMEAASTSEVSVNFYQTTRCNIPEDSHLQRTVNWKGGFPRPVVILKFFIVLAFKTHPYICTRSLDYILHKIVKEDKYIYGIHTCI